MTRVHLTEFTHNYPTHEYVIATAVSYHIVRQIPRDQAAGRHGLLKLSYAPVELIITEDPFAHGDNAYLRPPHLIHEAEGRAAANVS